jgi:hypothetical protein
MRSRTCRIRSYRNITSIDCFYGLWNFEFFFRHSSVVVIISCFYSFLSACANLPTRVCADNVNVLRNEYRYDGLMFKDQVMCKTCNLIKYDFCVCENS